MATLECVVNVLDLLVRSKPGAKLGKTDEDAEAVVQAWCLVLEPLVDKDVLSAAVKLARSDSDFLPSAGAVFQAVLDARDQEPDAGTAWMMVEKHARSGGVTALPGRVKAVLAAMGGNPGGWLEEERAFRRKEFDALYADAGKRWREAVVSGRLALPEPNERRLTDGD